MTGDTGGRKSHLRISRLTDTLTRAGSVMGAHPGGVLLQHVFGLRLQLLCRCHAVKPAPGRPVSLPLKQYATKMRSDYRMTTAPLWGSNRTL